MSIENIYTKVTLDLTAEMRKARERAEKSRVTKFMHEQVNDSELQKRARNMTQGERKQLREELGDEGILRMLRSGRNGV